MAGAFDDLRAHELAVIAGMRAALAAVLERFDPARIEARLAVPTVMDKMLSSSRKAKMWDRLVELYGEIAREADDDLQRLYGEKFSELTKSRWRACAAQGNKSGIITEEVLWRGRTRWSGPKACCCSPSTFSSTTATGKASSKAASPRCGPTAGAFPS
jgi:hypothetical protein